MANKLVVKPWGAHFSAPEEEQAYKLWRNNKAVPLMRLAGGVSLPIWLVSPAVADWFVGGDEATTWLSYGLVVPLLVLAMATSYVDRLRPWTMPIVSLVLGVTGCVFCLHIAVKDFESLGVAAGATLLFAMFAPFMRLPLGFALLAILPFAMPVLALIISAWAIGDLGLPEAWGYGTIGATTIFVVAVMCFVNDRSGRREYANERALENQQQAIRRYMPQAVANQILEGRAADIAQPQRRRLTILFCDIVGFTDIADRVEPEVMTEVLNAYMSAMAETIEEHGGTVNEFAGDGLMALFGAPDAMPPEDQARSAVKAAQAMQAKMPDLNESWRKLGLGAELKIRIGINTGMASVGSYGSEGRMTYTAIGLQTNIASRIESAAEPGRILLSDATYQLISDSMEFEPRGEVECKGVHFPVKVYAPPMAG